MAPERTPLNVCRQAAGSGTATPWLVHAAERAGLAALREQAPEPDVRALERVGPHPGAGRTRGPRPRTPLIPSGAFLRRPGLGGARCGDPFRLSAAQSERPRPVLPREGRGVARQRPAGRPRRPIVRAGRRGDAPAALGLLAGFVPGRRHDGRAIRDDLAARGALPVIPGSPSRTPHPTEPTLRRARNAIERTVARLKDQRRVAARRDKLAEHHRDAAAIAPIVRFWS